MPGLFQERFFTYGRMNDEHPHEEMNIHSERSTSLMNFVQRTSSSSGSESDSSLSIGGD